MNGSNSSDKSIIHGQSSYCLLLIYYYDARIAANIKIYAHA